MSGPAGTAAGDGRSWSVADHAWEDLEPSQAYEVLRLRVDVFVVEQACPYPELDGRDLEPATRHLRLLDHGPDGTRLAAYLRVLLDPDGARRVGRVVTAPSARGRGLAGRLLDRVVADHGGSALVLDAQAHLARWYARWGFEPSGAEFLEDGIPHVPMRRLPPP